MQDSRAEKAILQSATTQEGLRVQAQIVKDLFTGEGLQPNTASNTLEKYYKDFIIDHTQKAHEELQTVVGLSASQLAANENYEADLDKESSKKVIDYLLKTLRFDKLRKLYVLEGGVEGSRKSFLMDESLQALYEGTSVHLIGPIVQLCFKTQKDFVLLNVLSQVKDAKGVFMPFPLPSKNGQNELEKSEYTFLNFVVEEGGDIPGEDSHNHELWHTIDYFRRSVHRQLKPKGEEFKAFEYPEKEKERYTQETKFKERLDEYFFNSAEFVRQLGNLQIASPEMYTSYSSLDPFLFEALNRNESVRKNTAEIAFEKGFFAVSQELPAWIAGFLHRDRVDIISPTRKQAIIDKMISGYIPFGLIKLDQLQWRAKKDETGKWVVNNDKIGVTFNPWAASITEPDAKSEEMLDRYSKKQGYTRVSINTSQYSEDLQRFIDFFFNKGGAGYEAIEKSKVCVGKSIDAFTKLALFRQNPYQALIELSLLPISHWEVYTKRKTG